MVHGVGLVDINVDLERDGFEVKCLVDSFLTHTMATDRCMIPMVGQYFRTDTYVVGRIRRVSLTHCITHTMATDRYMIPMVGQYFIMRPLVMLSHISTRIGHKQTARG
eukprot:753913-Prymnesium_polylepis.1